MKIKATKVIESGIQKIETSAEIEVASSFAPDADLGREQIKRIATTLLEALNDPSNEP